MIKYSHRGLIINGAVSNLFEKLYTLIVASCTALFYSFTFSGKIEKKFLYKICRGEDTDFIDFNSIKTAAMLLAFSLSMTVLYSLMYFSCIYLIRTKRVTVNGKFQRNVLTLKDTYMLAVTSQSFFISGLILASFFKFSPESLKICFIFVEISMITVNGYILPIYILVKLYYKMPAFYSNKKETVTKFYQNQTKNAKILIPRPQKSQFSHLPYLVSSNIQETPKRPTLLEVKKIPMIIVSPSV